MFVKLTPTYILIFLNLSKENLQKKNYIINEYYVHNTVGHQPEFLNKRDHFPLTQNQNPQQHSKLIFTQPIKHHRNVNRSKFLIYLPRVKVQTIATAPVA